MLVSISPTCCTTTFTARTRERAEVLHVDYHNAQYRRGLRAEALPLPEIAVPVPPQIDPVDRVLEALRGLSTEDLLRATEAVLAERATEYATGGDTESYRFTYDDDSGEPQNVVVDFSRGEAYM